MATTANAKDYTRHYLHPGPGQDSPSPSSPTLPSTPPCLPSPPAATSSGKPKSFCDTIADGVNLVIDSLGTIYMDVAQLPDPYATRQVPSPLAHWDLSEARYPSSASLQTCQVPVPASIAPQLEPLTHKRIPSKNGPRRRRRRWHPGVGSLEGT